MGVKGYPIASNLSTKTHRLGCSVCKKKINNNTPTENISSKPWIDKKYLKNKVSDKNCQNCEYVKLAPTVTISPKINECYCNYMKQTKNESFPELICSMRFTTPHLTNVDEKWLNEIIEFRRQNWFDCHADSFIDGICVKKTIPLNIFNEQKLNCNYQNNSISLSSIDGDELRTENPFVYLEDTTAVEKHLNGHKKTTVSKFAGKKKKSNAVHKPWIPPSPSVHYKF